MEIEDDDIRNRSHTDSVQNVEPVDTKPRQLLAGIVNCIRRARLQGNTMVCCVSQPLGGDGAGGDVSVRRPFTRPDSGETEAEGVQRELLRI